MYFYEDHPVCSHRDCAPFVYCLIPEKHIYAQELAMDFDADLPDCPMCNAPVSWEFWEEHALCARCLTADEESTDWEMKW